MRLMGCACLLAGVAFAQAPQSIPSAGAQWTTYNGDMSGRRFSTLTQVNSANVKGLALAWAFPTRGLAI